MSVAFVPEKTRISVDRYQKMIATGVLGEHDRIELIEGEMVNTAPTGPKHAALTARLTKHFVLSVGDTAIVSPGGPVKLGDYYAKKIPKASDVLLLVEISDSTLSFDQGTKRALYARHGVAEYWIIDVEGERILIHRDPTVDGYMHLLEFGLTDGVSPLALPAAELLVQDLFR
jgi:Uma2 family endonuclease